MQIDYFHGLKIINTGSYELPRFFVAEWTSGFRVQHLSAMPLRGMPLRPLTDVAPRRITTEPSQLFAGLAIGQIWHGGSSARPEP